MSRRDDENGGKHWKPQGDLRDLTESENHRNNHECRPLRMNPDEASVSVVHKAVMLERSAEGTVNTAVETGPECESAR